ncbi:putative Fe-S cluster assembly protein SufT [Verrucomicrobiota bacterium sgz303538]
MNPYEPIALTRDVEAIQIPSGHTVTLPAGTEVTITQSLGGTYTVAAMTGGLFRIPGTSADALGKDVTEHKVVEGPFEEKNVWDQLHNVYDPEIPVNIVDLGLIYGMNVTDDESGKGKRVSVQMTLTAPGCGMGPTLAAEAEQRILSLPGVASANVELVWDPPWSPERISPEGKMKLGIE